MDWRIPGFPVHYQLPELTQIYVHRVSDAMQPPHPLLFPYPPTFNLPSIRVFSNESVLHIRWPKYWSFSFSISPSNEYSGLASLRIDWLDLPAVQGTLKSVLQHHSSKASIQKQHCMDHNKLWKILKRWEYQTTWPASQEICMKVRKKQLKLDMEQQTGSKSGRVRQGCILSPWLFHLYAE